MTPKQSPLEAAADEYEKDHHMDTPFLAFLAGAQWALAHSPEVRGLRAALEYVGHGCMHSRTHCPSREHMQRVAREALAAWREGEK